jgi:hypothetical protein
MLLLAALAWPIQGLDVFAPETAAIFEFAFFRYVTNATVVVTTTLYKVDNQTVVKNVTSSVTRTYATLLGEGWVTLKGKGGLSAGNPLTLSMTMYFYAAALGTNVANVSFAPQGAYIAQVPNLPFFPIVVQTDTRGFPLSPTIGLAKLGDHWTGQGLVIYNQGGAKTINIIINGVTYHSPDTVEIGSEAVTVAARTNSLLVSLTWVIIAFTVLELREK